MSVSRETTLCNPPRHSVQNASRLEAISTSVNKATGPLRPCRWLIHSSSSRLAFQSRPWEMYSSQSWGGFWAAFSLGLQCKWTPHNLYSLPGAAVRSPFLRGRYHSVARRAQQSSGWQHSLCVHRESLLPHRLLLRLSMSDCCWYFRKSAGLHVQCFIGLDWFLFPGWGSCPSINWKRMKEIGVSPLLGLSISCLDRVSWPGDIFVPSHLSAIFWPLQPAPRCGTLQSTLWLMLVQPEISHPKPCRSILKHHSICPLWSFFSFFFTLASDIISWTLYSLSSVVRSSSRRMMQGDL